MKLYDKVYPILRKIAGVFAKISMVVMLLSVFYVCVDIVMRFVFNKPMSGSTELVELSMCVIVFFSFAYGQTEKAHIQVTTLISHYPYVLKFILYSIMELLSTVVCGAMSYGCLRQMLSLYKSHRISAQYGIPIYPFYGAAGVALALFTIILLFDAMLSVYAIFDKSCGEKISDRWL